MIVQRLNLNLIPNQSPVIVHVNQYDTGTGRLIATLYEGNEPYSPNGTAVIQGTKPDGHGFQYSATLDGNVVTADLTEQMAPVAGDVRAQIVVTESSGVTGTFAFIIRVQPSALPSDADMSESDYQYIEEAIREAQEAVQTAQEATETAQEAVERAEAAISETQENAEDSEAWAQGTRGGIPVEPTDPTYEHNAEYWAQYAERYAQGGLHYKASIPFVDIPTTGMREGNMYDITDDFTTDSRFTEGAGIKVKGGTNIAWNSDNKWDILALPYIPKTTFNGRSGSILPMAGDYDSEKILLSSALHIGGETQNDVQEALEALSDDGVKSFNGRSGSVLPMAGDYSAEQVNYDSNQTVKQKIDALVTKEASDIAGQQSLVKDTVGWTGKNKFNGKATTKTAQGVTWTVNASDNNIVTVSGTPTGFEAFTVDSKKVLPVGEYVLSGISDMVNVVWNAVILYKNGVLVRDLHIDNENVPRTFSILASDNYDTIRVQLKRDTNNVVCSGTGKIMITDARITDPTYEPYHESVETMYEEEIHGVNLLENKCTSQTVNGLTVTVNADKSVKITGTASTATNVIIQQVIAATENILDNLEIGQSYIFSGCPAGGANNTYAMVMNQRTVSGGTVSYKYDTGSGYEFTYDGTFTSYQMMMQIWPAAGNVNLTFYPMIRKADKADIDDPTYRPYNPQAIQNQLNAQGVLGAKNLCPITANTQTINGVTYTVNKDSDGSVLNVTVNGTATATSVFLLSTRKYAEKNYILSGCPKGGNQGTTYALQIRDTNNNTIIADEGNGGSRALSSDTDYRAVIRIGNGYTANNLVFYPMLRLASDPDDTYVPYAMTNRELTEKSLLKPFNNIISNVDLDNIISSGCYVLGGNITHGAGNYGILIVFTTSTANTQVRQIFMNVTEDAFFTRHKNDGTWSSWYKFTGTIVS